MDILSKLTPAMKGPGLQPAVAAHEPLVEGDTDTRVVSVRIKGMVVFSALIAYALLIVVFVFHQKNQLLGDFDQIQRSLEADTALKQADAAAFHAVMAVFINIDADDRGAGMQRVWAHYQLLRSRYEELLERMPSLSMDLGGVDRAIENATGDPSRENMNVLVSELVRIKDAFGAEAERTQDSRQRMSEQFRSKTNSVAVTTLLLGMMGLGLLGAFTGLFFRRLTEDLASLQNRALDIVRGYRGEPLPIRRQDEVGQLMRAVNSMATELDKREKELIVERQKYFHQEKMAAIGTLAAGVAHEIGNPIAAIAGIAQEIADRSNACSTEEDSSCGRCRADLIQDQIERLAAITREISEFASPQTTEPQLLSLNAQLRSTSSLLRYDRRLARIEVQLDLDPQLPAIQGVADQVTQVIMNLLLNAADALESVTERTAVIAIQTRLDGERICMSVSDNGIGMDATVREHAIDAFFTTKPAGKGTGLGLSLCYSIMQSHGGSIEIESEPGQGTRVLAYFPLSDAG